MKNTYFGLHLHTLFQDDEGTNGLTVFLRRHGSHLYVTDAGHVIEVLLDLTRIDVLTATDDHVLDAARDLIEALLVFHAQVARVQIAVLVDHLSRCTPTGHSSPVSGSITFTSTNG